MRPGLFPLSLMALLAGSPVFAAGADAPTPEPAERFQMTAEAGRVEVRTRTIRALCRRARMLSDGRTLLLEAGDREPIEFWGFDVPGREPKKRLARSIRIEFYDGLDTGKYVMDIIEKGDPPDPKK